MIEAINSTYDLQGIVFSDFLRVLFESNDEYERASMCYGIVERIHPWSFERIMYARKRVVELEILKEYLFENRDRPNYMGQYRAASLDTLIVECREYLARCSAAETAELGPRTKDLFDSYSYGINRMRLSSVLSEISVAQTKAFPSLSDGVARGLVTLANLETDQLLIIYIGKMFHMLVNSVDAYSGILFSADYFDNDERAKQDVVTSFLRFSQAEKENGLQRMKELGAASIKAEEKRGTRAKEIQLSVGDPVFHRTLGKGVVSQVSGEMVEVEFEGSGDKKRLMIGYAPLEKID